MKISDALPVILLFFSANAGATGTVPIHEPGIAGLLLAAGVIGVIVAVRRRKKK